MFDGSAKARRTIGLGGQSRTASRAKLLEEAKRKRNARKQAKAEAKAIVVLQRAFRTHAARRQVAARARAAWDASMRSCEQQPLETVSREALSELLRGAQGLSLARHGDDARQWALCSLICRQTDCAAGSEQFLKPRDAQQGADQQWHRQLNHLLRIACCVPDSSSPISAEEMLERLSRCASLGTWVPDAPLLLKGLKECLETEASPGILLSILGLTRAALSRMPDGSATDAAHDGILEIFSTVAVTSCCEEVAGTLLALLRLPPPEKLMAAIRRAASPTHIVSLNVTHLMAKCISESAVMLPHLADEGVLRCLVGRETADPPEDEDYDMDDDEDVEEAETQSLRNLKAVVEGLPMEQMVLDAIAKVQRSNEPLSELIAVAHLCNIVRLFGSPMEHAKVFSRLAFSSDFVPLVWKQLASQSKRVEEYLEAVIPPDSPLSRTTGLFFSVASSLLLATDDREFFETDKFLSLEQWKALTLFVKRVIECHFVRRYELFAPAPEQHPSYEPALRLFSMLCDRQDRREFLSATDLHSEVVLRLVEGRKERIRQVAQLVPAFVPLAERYAVLQADLDSHSYGAGMWRRGIEIKIRREHLFEDAISTLGSQPVEVLRDTVRVHFVDQTGAEAGVDGGGLFREFLTDVLQMGFNPEMGLFKATESGELYPNPASLALDDEESKTVEESYRFLGSMLVCVAARMAYAGWLSNAEQGKALFDSVLIYLPLAKHFISQILGKRHLPIDSLASLDPVLSQNLRQVQDCEGGIEEWDLTFSVSKDNTLGECGEVDLIENGSEVRVTMETRMQYVLMVAKYRLETQIKRQRDAFLTGFYAMVERDWVSIFNETEFQEMISGKEHDSLDIADLKANTVYHSRHTGEAEVIRWFWEVLESFTPKEQVAFLKFVTSTVRSPLMGFKQLVPAFCINVIGDPKRLPTASTCMNLLKLPGYASREILEEKLRTALSNSAGFHMS